MWMPVRGFSFRRQSSLKVTSSQRAASVPPALTGREFAPAIGDAKYGSGERSPGNVPATTVTLYAFFWARSNAEVKPLTPPPRTTTEGLLAEAAVDIFRCR